MSLFNKYRPRTFADLVGQKSTVTILKNAITSGRYRDFGAILLAGPRGTGKTTISRILAKALNCERGVTTEPCLACAACKSIENDAATDFQEIDAASKGRVDNIRDIRNQASFSSLGLRFKFWTIDECHRLTPEAWDAFLKTLEEPPPNTVFVLATTEVNKVPETIMSRVLDFTFRRLNTDDIYFFLQKVCSAEGVEYDENALRMIAKNARGGMRDALTNLEKAILAANGSKITEVISAQVINSFDSRIAIYMAESILTGDLKTTLLFTNALEKNAVNPATILDSAIECLHGIWTYQITGNEEVLLYGAADQRDRLLYLAQQFDNERLGEAIYSLGQSFKALPYNPNPKYFLDVSIQKAIVAYRKAR